MSEWPGRIWGVVSRYRWLVLWAIAPAIGFDAMNTSPDFNPLHYKHILFVGFVLLAIVETPWVNRRFEGRLATLSALLLVAMFAFMCLAVFGTMLVDG